MNTNSNRRNYVGTLYLARRSIRVIRVIIVAGYTMFLTIVLRLRVMMDM